MATLPCKHMYWPTAQHPPRTQHSRISTQSAKECSYSYPKHTRTHTCSARQFSLYHADTAATSSSGTRSALFSSTAMGGPDQSLQHAYTGEQNIRQDVGVNKLLFNQACAVSVSLLQRFSAYCPKGRGRLVVTLHTQPRHVQHTQYCTSHHFPSLPRS